MRQNEIGVLVKNGGMCPIIILPVTKSKLNFVLSAATLHGNEELRVSEVSKAIFYAEGISMVRSLSVELKTFANL